MAAYTDVNTPVLGMPGGIIPKTWLEPIAEAGVPLFWLEDGDDPGRDHYEHARRELEPLGASLHTIKLGAYGDVNKALQVLGADGLRAFIDSAIAEALAESFGDLRFVRDLLPAELDRRAARTHPSYGTGLGALDALLEGGYQEGLHLLGGTTRGGKTSLALAIALHNALAGRPVLYVTYEQSPFELWARLIAQLPRVPYAAVKRGSFDDKGLVVRTSSQLKNDEGWEEVQRASRHLRIVSGGDAFSQNQSGLSLMALERLAQDVATARGMPPLVIVDYLQRVPVAALANRDPRERVMQVAGTLQTIFGRDLLCPVLALSSVGREAYDLQRASLEKKLAAFKEAGEIEYTAYTAMLLYPLADDLLARCDMSPGMLNPFRPMTLDVVKQREGETGKVAVKWIPKTGVWKGAKRL